VEALSTHDAQLLDELQLLVECKRRELKDGGSKAMNPSLLKPRSGKRSMGAKLMFALRGIAVALTFFVLFYCLLSALVLAAWRSLQRLQ